MGGRLITDVKGEFESPFLNQVLYWCLLIGIGNHPFKLGNAGSSPVTSTNKRECFRVSVVELVDTLHCECSHCGFEARRTPQNILAKTLDILSRLLYH